MTRFAVLLLLTLLGLQACSLGDERPPVPPGGDITTNRPRVVDPEIENWFRSNAAASGIRVIPGDRISITVQGNGDLSVTRDVPPDGSIPVYKTDKVVNALQKTPQELEREIAAAYAVKYQDPYVTVTLEAAAPRSISVIGSVKNQDKYHVSGNDRLTVLQALALAGGSTEQADLRNVVLQRVHPGRGEVVSSPPLDIQRAMSGEQRDNLIVQPGDTIVVPNLLESRVQVMGKVKRPGSVPWYRGMTISRAIAEAGGFDTFPKTNKIQIVRHGNQDITFNFDAMLDGEVPDLELEPADVIYIHERWL